MTSKYDPLSNYLAKQTKDRCLLGFHKIERITKARLPKAAYIYREWWANELNKETKHTQAKSWIRAGWRVKEIDLEGEAVVFARTR